VSDAIGGRGGPGARETDGILNREARGLLRAVSKVALFGGRGDGLLFCTLRFRFFVLAGGDGDDNGLESGGDEEILVVTSLGICSEC
jgi:hypothetical protein